MAAKLTPNDYPGRVRKMRRAWGKTQAFLAERLGVDASTFRRYERGLEPIPDEHRFALAYLFGCTEEWLMGCIEEPMTRSEEPL